MRTLPLYPEIPRLAVEQEGPRDLNDRCRRCPLHEEASTVCMAADGQVGGLLVVGKGVGYYEQRNGRPQSGPDGSYLRQQIRNRHDGPVCYAQAIACPLPRDGDVKVGWVHACRSYLTKVIQEVQPTRILCLGAEAILAITGRPLAPLGARRGNGWLHAGALVKVDTPVFFLPSPASIRRNRFRRRSFEQDLDHAVGGIPFRIPRDIDVKIVENVEDAEEAEEDLIEASWVSTDVESYGESFTPEFQLFCVSAYGRGSDRCYVWDVGAVEDLKVREPLIRLLTNPAIPKCLQNGKSDLLGFRCAWGIDMEGFAFDTRIIRRMLEPEARADLQLLSEIVGMGGYKQAFQKHVDEAGARLNMAAVQVESKQLRLVPINPLIDHAGRCIAAGTDTRVFSYRFTPPDVCAIYNAKDSICTSIIGDVLDKRLDEWPQLRQTWTTMMLECNAALAKMEIWGIPVNETAVSNLSGHLQRKIAKIMEVFEPYEIDLGSPEQVGKLLYERLGLPIKRRTDGGQPSTDKHALKELQGQHDVVDALLEFRRLDKLRGTYADGMLPFIRPDGRVHGTYLIGGTRTGRPSMHEPNLLNLPRRGGREATMVKDCFQAAGQDIRQDLDWLDRWVFVEVDESQIELRIAAAESRDPKMIQIYESGLDFHLETARNVARVVWGIGPEDVKPWHRDVAKTTNFLTIYGGGPGKLAEGLNDQRKSAKDPFVTKTMAATIIDGIAELFPVYAAWGREQISYARRHGYVWVNGLDGSPARFRFLHDIGNDDQDDYRRIQAEHGAVNSPIQGRAAYVTLGSLSAIVEWCQQASIEVEVNLTVYDSVLLRCRRRHVQVVASAARDILTSYDIGVPLVVDAKVGTGLGSMKDYDFGPIEEIK